MKFEGFKFSSDNKTVVEYYKLCTVDNSYIIYITAFSYKDFIQ